RDPFAAAEDDRRRVLLELDVALRRETHPREVRLHDGAELRLREQQHVVCTATPDEQRRDHARLRRQQQRVDRPRLGNVVREHPVQVLDRVGSPNANVGAPHGSRVDRVFRSKAEKKVVELGYDPARLPPGQYLTEKWPVLHAGSIAEYKDLSTWTLRVFGEVENEVELTWEQFDELPRSGNTQDI